MVAECQRPDFERRFGKGKSLEHFNEISARYSFSHGSVLERNDIEQSVNSVLFVAFDENIQKIIAASVIRAQNRDSPPVQNESVVNDLEKSFLNMLNFYNPAPADAGEGFRRIHDMDSGPRVRRKNNELLAGQLFFQFRQNTVSKRVVERQYQPDNIILYRGRHFNFPENKIPAFQNISGVRHRQNLDVRYFNYKIEQLPQSVFRRQRKLNIV